MPAVQKGLRRRLSLLTFPLTQAKVEQRRQRGPFIATRARLLTRLERIDRVSPSSIDAIEDVVEGLIEGLGLNEAK